MPKSSTQPINGKYGGSEIEIKPPKPRKKDGRNGVYKNCIEKKKLVDDLGLFFRAERAGGGGAKRRRRRRSEANLLFFFY